MTESALDNSVVNFDIAWIDSILTLHRPNTSLTTKPCA